MAATVIEIAGPRNENVLFGPLGQNLRGRWSHVVAGGMSMHESLAALHSAAPGGSIPGIHLSLDPQERVARRIEPLTETDEGRQCWEAVAPVFERYQEFLTRPKPWEPLTLTSLTDDQIKTWAFEMRNLLDCGLARHVSGAPLPTLDAIRKMPGGRFVKSWIGGQDNPGNVLVDVVPARTGTSSGTAGGASNGTSSGTANETTKGRGQQNQSATSQP